MSKRSVRRPARSAARAQAARERSTRDPSVDERARVVALGAPGLLALEDPLAAEEWASAVLGTLVARDVLPAITHLAEARADPAGRAVLEALASVAEPEDAAPVRAAARRMAKQGIESAPWAPELGSAELAGAWVVTEDSGGHEGYYAAFRYPGRRPHLVTAVIDAALGEVVKDASVGYLAGDPGPVLEAMTAAEPGMSVREVDPATMARRILDAVAAGDHAADDVRTDEFRRTRALVLARMRSLSAVTGRS